MKRFLSTTIYLNKCFVDVFSPLLSHLFVFYSNESSFRSNEIKKQFSVSSFYLTTYLLLEQHLFGE